MMQEMNLGEQVIYQRLMLYAQHLVTQIYQLALNFKFLLYQAAHNKTLLYTPPWMEYI